MRSTDLILSQLTQLTRDRRLIRLHYKKPFEIRATSRLVEPYHLTSFDGQLMLCAWQVEPAVDESWCGRTFRLDRIRLLEDAGKTFTPRYPITLDQGIVQPFGLWSDPQPNIVYHAHQAMHGLRPAH